ncbi:MULTISPECIES: hypothetical protein [unclassified Novosphingobium]|uniref:hypothetical protein n=1 Tax=unclassified Novosphingobium TaxID=2644732 RepID=UPI0025F0F189|nr:MULTISPECIES: hypothetical protein [unclassified Novosphingobium]
MNISIAKKYYDEFIEWCSDNEFEVGAVKTFIDGENLHLKFSNKEDAVLAILKFI